ncbi:hypothetical protein [Mycobacteroides abscessus]|uniref:hypothetical protein n=1 Tax=Mycobacteroides abscessus TaxID=36809 RepID=UPI0009A5A912|nr:hypothetical protein [Mycobacteroides abscessus]SLJ76181.1 Uncharacterised protein [Mycobacteroides abscessus subsp. abscessus]SLJ80589.1 Uncharacterised protein [Mycobacteroides abscessus subsp. abscessus]
MTSPDVLSSTDLDVLSVFISAGADPSRLAHWMRENTDTHAPVDALALAGEVLRATTRFADLP